MKNVVLCTLNAKFIHSSLALRYLRESIREVSRVTVLEYTIHDPLDQIIAGIFEAEPDVIGLSCYIWNIEKIEKLVPELRKVLPQAFLLLGGPEVSYDAMHYISRHPEIDAVAVGEGEELLRELLAAIKHGESVGSVQGLYYRYQGQVQFSGTRPNVQLLNSPTPYPEDSMAELKHKVVYYETSRGCPFTCQFCLSSTEEKVRFFPLERVLDDLGRLIAHQVKQINFVDRTFNLRTDYALALFSFLASTAGDTVFHFEITGDILHPELVDWLTLHAPKGKFRFEVGVQSTNELANQAVKRRQDFHKLAQTVKRIKESGKIHQHLDLIAGLPHEDYRSFRKSFNDVYELGPDEIQLGFLKLLRGTNLRAEAEKYGYIAMDTSPYEILASKELSYKDLLQLKRLEDILEKYYNSGRFPHVLAYVAEERFETPFDFFQAFGDYWHRQGWSRIGQQPLDLIFRLREFLQQAGVWDEIADALLRIDYLLREKQRPRKLFWRGHQEESVQLRWLNGNADILLAYFPVLSEEFRRPDFMKRMVLDRIPRKAMEKLLPTFAAAQIHAEDWTLGTILFVYPAAAGTPAIFGLAT